MSDDADDCGCCAGTGVATPEAKFNPPGLPAVAYRIGTRADFLASLRARLSGADVPALAALTTRDPGDWTIALCEAFASMADVVTFYQERIANESYLRTATERRSVLELARLLGYALAPGVAATTRLAFTLDAPPGVPASSLPPVTVPLGTRVQSIPDAGQAAQTFETTADVEARVGWNAIPVAASRRVKIETGLTGLDLDGLATQLQVGDALLLVGSERVHAVASNRWDFRFVAAVAPDAARGLTHVDFDRPLGSSFPPMGPTAAGVRCFALRARAARFGYNAPAAPVLTLANLQTVNRALSFSKGGAIQDALEDVGDLTFDPDVLGPVLGGVTVHAPARAALPHLDLDAAYPKMGVGGWVVLTGGSGADDSPQGYVELYGIAQSAAVTRTRDPISAKITRLTLDTATNLDKFDERGTTVFGQSEALALARRPVVSALVGTTIALQGVQLGLAPSREIAILGKRARIGFGAQAEGVVFEGQSARRGVAGDTFPLRAAPTTLAGDAVSADELDDPKQRSRTLRWPVVDHDGGDLVLRAAPSQLVWAAPAKDDPVVSEVVTIAAAGDAVQADLDEGVTVLRLDAALRNAYDRFSATVNANVAPATHGETVSELVGNGDAATANQAFVLRQAPLTYVPDDHAASGASATLELRANDLLWREVPSLYPAAAQDRVYTVRQGDDGRSTIAFGDGVQGARLPTGTNNVRARYRKGIGAAGNLRSGQLTTLLSRPPGVKAVLNPVDAAGGQDPETLDAARANAPLRVLTLDRAVSVTDYADFARAFAGIAKADGLWVEYGRARGIHLTVAAPAGAAVADDLRATLAGALRGHGDPLMPLSIQSYADARFALEAVVKMADDADPVLVFAAVDAAIRAAFAFEARAFGQPVTADQVYAVIQGVRGVVASDLVRFYRLDTGPQASPASRLLAARPVVTGAGGVTPAELLTLEPTALKLGAMP